MKKASSLLIIFLSIVFTNFSSAQYALNSSEKNKTTLPENPIKTPYVFVFNGFSHDYELDNITTEMAGEHPFGDKLAKKLFLLGEKYTSEVELIPGNPQTKTVIQKPVIYNAVRRIEKQLKKSVRNGEISLETASADLNKVLDIALNILNTDTKDFEAAIESMNDNTAKIELFTKGVNLIY
jgi:hypothetical protein